MELIKVGKCTYAKAETTLDILEGSLSEFGVINTGNKGDIRRALYILITGENPEKTEKPFYHEKEQEVEKVFSEILLENMKNLEVILMYINTLCKLVCK